MPTPEGSNYRSGFTPELIDEILAQGEMTTGELDAAYEKAKARNVDVAALKRAFSVLYDLATAAIDNSEWDDSRRVYEMDEEVRNDLAGFLADFHDDNETLWNLLTDEQKSRSKGK